MRGAERSKHVDARIAPEPKIHDQSVKSALGDLPLGSALAGRYGTPADGADDALPGPTDACVIVHDENRRVHRPPSLGL
jgi:hypothetical protein